jgi:hypothetical protein
MAARRKRPVPSSSTAGPTASSPASSATGTSVVWPPLRMPTLRFLYGRDVVDQLHVQAGAGQLQLFADPCRALDHEQVVVLGRHQELVLVAEILLDLFRVGARIAGDDAVDQGRAEGAGLLDPGVEGRVQLPQAGEVQHGLLERRAVLVDQFAGQQHQALVLAPFEGLEALEQELGQLGREGAGGASSKRSVSLTAMPASVVFETTKRSSGVRPAPGSRRTSCSDPARAGRIPPCGIP